MVFNKPNFLEINQSGSKLIEINFNKILAENKLSDEFYASQVITNFKGEKILEHVEFDRNKGGKMDHL